MDLSPLFCCVPFVLPRQADFFDHTVTRLLHVSAQSLYKLTKRNRQTRDILGLVECAVPVVLIHFIFMIPEKDTSSFYSFQTNTNLVSARITTNADKTARYPLPKHFVFFLRE